MTAYQIEGSCLGSNPFARAVSAPPRARKLLRSGLLVDLERPRPVDIRLDDIAHALAHQSRFGGHGEQSATVAQHSVHVSRICLPERARWALLHDAAECYLGDVSTELKRVLPYFKELEQRWTDVISERFGVPPVDVKYWDIVSLLTERRDNGPWGISDQELLGSAPATQLPPLDPEYYGIWPACRAKYTFLARARELEIY